MLQYQKTQVRFPSQGLTDTSKAPMDRRGRTSSSRTSTMSRARHTRASKAHPWLHSLLDTQARLCTQPVRGRDVLILCIERRISPRAVAIGITRKMRKKARVTYPPPDHVR